MKVFFKTMFCLSFFCWQEQTSWEHIWSLNHNQEQTHADVLADAAAADNVKNADIAVMVLIQ